VENVAKDLAEFALRVGYPLQPPLSLSSLFQLCPYINRAIIDQGRGLGILFYSNWNSNTAPWLRPVFAAAVYSQDLQLLQDSLPGLAALNLEYVIQLMSLAIDRDWSSDLERILSPKYAPGLHAYALMPPVRECIRKALGNALGKMLAVPKSSACWNVFLNQNIVWLDAVFTVAWDEHSFFGVREVVRNYTSKMGLNPGTPRNYLHTYGCDRRQYLTGWLDGVRRSLDCTSFEERPLRGRSPSERRLIFVAALVDQQVAESVARATVPWMGPDLTHLLLQPDTNARAYTTDNPINIAAHRFPAAAVQSTLERVPARPFSPEDRREAEEIAGVLRHWLGMHGGPTTLS
jgi:hypothetical protein